MGTVTLGVSIAVPEPYGSFLQRKREGFGDPAAPGIPTHITLLPPTQVRADALPAIERHLAEVAAGFRPFPLRLEGTGTFRPLSPVVFVKVAEGVAGCTALQARIRAASGPLRTRAPVPVPPACDRRPRHRRRGHGPRPERAQGLLRDVDDRRLRALRAGPGRGLAPGAGVPLRAAVGRRTRARPPISPGRRHPPADRRPPGAGTPSPAATADAAARPAMIRTTRPGVPDRPEQSPYILHRPAGTSGTRRTNASDRTRGTPWTG